MRALLTQKEQRQLRILEYLFENPDWIHLDPLAEALDINTRIIKSDIKKVVYVSCNGATLTRDLKYFIDAGLELKKVKLCDMFSKTAHCEVVVFISR